MRCPASEIESDVSFQKEATTAQVEQPFGKNYSKSCGSNYGFNLIKPDTKQFQQNVLKERTMIIFSLIAGLTRSERLKVSLNSY